MEMYGTAPAHAHLHRDDLRRLWREGRPHWRWVLLSMICAAVAAAGTAAFAYAIGPLLADIFSGAHEGDRSAGGVWSWGYWPTGAKPLSRSALVGIILGLAILRGFAQFGRMFFMDVASERVRRSIAAKLYWKVLQLDSREVSSLEAGDLISRVSNNLVLLRVYLAQRLSQNLTDGIQLLILLLAAFSMDPMLGTIGVGLLPVVIAVILWFSRRVRTAEQQQLKTLGRVSVLFGELLRGHAEIRTRGVEGWCAARFDEMNQAYGREVVRSARLLGSSWPVLELLAAVAIAVAVWYVSTQWKAGIQAPEDIVTSVAVVFLLGRSAKNLAMVGQNVARFQAVARQIYEILDLPEPAGDEGKQDAPALKSGIELEDIRFEYGGNRVLSGVRFRIEAGRVTALVGLSGAGKTTVARLLCRLLPATEGGILWDGRPLDSLTDRSLRRRIGLVGQEPFILNDTIRVNLTFGRDDVGDDDLWQALELVDAAGFVGRLPRQLDERIGEGGAMLSRGEEQRLCLARFARVPCDLLILDEATASLDSESEAKILQGLRDQGLHPTILLISHRLSSVKQTEHVVVLDDGRIVEEGGFDELVTCGLYFRQLFRNQIIGSGEASGGGVASGKVDLECVGGEQRAHRTGRGV